MAKGLRCKFRRKMRNVKREKYEKRELERLKKILDTSGEQDQEMKEIYKVKTAAELREEMQQKKEDNAMEHSGKSFNPKTLQDENGHYPAWMNQRAIKKHKKKLKISKAAKVKAKAKNKMKGRKK